MKKISFIVIFGMTAYLVTSCGSSYNNSRKSEDEFMEKIESAINKDDASILIEQFSKELQEDENLKVDAKDFLDFIEGDVVECEYEGGLTSDEKNEDKGYSCITQASYTLTTTAASYDIEFVIYLDALSEEKIGVQNLGVQEIEDQKEDICVAPDYKGIYTVTSDNHDEIRALEEAACEED